MIIHCPGTLAHGHETYSRLCLKRLFEGRKVSHILPYDSPVSQDASKQLFHLNSQRISISGVQEKYSLVQEKNKLRLAEKGEQGSHILKPIPSFGKQANQIPANEHLTMQIARQVYGIETAENALIFFKNGDPAYLTKRFDLKIGGEKWAQEDFASLARKTTQTHGTHYKYQGNYLELFELMKKVLPAYQIESIRLLKLIVFNYLFSNGDAHLKNFSVLESPQGDFRLSPAYDLLNTKIHVDDSTFALDEGLLPPKIASGPIANQFRVLVEEAGINHTIATKIFQRFSSSSDKVKSLVDSSFLTEKTKRNYWQAYQARLKKLL